MFFEKHYGYRYTLEDKKLFVNLWFLLIVISDVLCIVGTGIKIAITFHVSTLDCKMYSRSQVLQPTYPCRLICLETFHYYTYADVKSIDLYGSRFMVLFGLMG